MKEIKKILKVGDKVLLHFLPNGAPKKIAIITELGMGRHYGEDVLIDYMISIDGNKSFAVHPDIVELLLDESILLLNN